MAHNENCVSRFKVWAAVISLGLSIGCLPAGNKDGAEPSTAGKTVSTGGVTTAGVPAANGGKMMPSGGDDARQSSDMGTSQVDAAARDLCPRATARITANHDDGRHVHMIPSDDIKLGDDKTYSIQGEADHDHTVMFNGFHFGLLQLGKRAMLTSSEGNGHTHSIEVRCATGN